MQGGGNIIVEFARRAAALARFEWAARVAARRRRPVRKYRGVHHRENRYCSVIWNIYTRRLLWLGSYKTPEEAAYAWDAAARLTRGRHWAKTNFPEPAAWAWAWAWAVPAPEVVSPAELVLALPMPATAPARRRDDQAAAVAAQVSFDNWLLSSSAAAAEPLHRLQGAPAVVLPDQQQLTAAALPPFTQFFHLSGPAAAAAANNGGGAVVNPSNPGAYVLTTQNVKMLPTNPATTALSGGAAPTHHRELPVSQASVSDLAVVEDNFTYDGTSTSAAPPPVPPLTPKDLLLQIGLPAAGRGGPGGAQ